MTEAYAPDWRHQATCATYSPELWDALSGPRKNHDIAKYICNTLCPVKAECLGEVLTYSNDEDSGVVRAGLGVRERRELRKQLREAS